MDVSTVGLGWPRRNVLLVLAVCVALYFLLGWVIWPPVWRATGESAAKAALAAYRDPSHLGPKSRELLQARTRELGVPENVRVIRWYTDITLWPAMVQLSLKRNGEDYIEEVVVMQGHVASLREKARGHSARQYILDDR